MRVGGLDRFRLGGTSSVRVSNVTPVVVVIASCLGLVSTACNQKVPDPPGVATPALTIEPSRAPLGSPVDMTFRFQVAPDAPPFGQDYRVFVHVQDIDDEKLWNDDHDPPTPTTAWKPGQTIEYTRTAFVPIHPYVGTANVKIGLYSAKDGSRVPLIGETTGQRAYDVATMELLPQSENVFLLYKDGWQSAEVAESDPTVEWQWTRREATIVFTNPRRDALFYLHLDGRPDLIGHPQTVSVAIGDAVLDTFELKSTEAVIRKIPITAAQLGTDDKIELKIDAGASFVPATLPGSTNRDRRELGVRVFHAFVRPTSLQASGQ
jgi:hypothetical protein